MRERLNLWWDKWAPKIAGVFVVFAILGVGWGIYEQHQTAVSQLQSQRILRTLERDDAIVCQFVKLVVGSPQLPAAQRTQLERAAQNCPPLPEAVRR